jgi:MOSC domain-containing protein YiiM
VDPEQAPSASARVLGIAVRTASGVPLREVEETAAPADGWLEGDHGGSAKRGVTLLSRETWAEVNARLGTDLPWIARRANVLVEGLDLMACVARTLRVGEVHVHVLGETRPCEEMDKAWSGLRRVLETRGFGGVYGRVVRGGTVRVGDPIEVVAGR